MLSPAEKASFGKAIANLRREKGLTQKELVGRIGTYYSDVRNYRRVESGERRPSRDAAIAILTGGLLLTDPERIDALLARAGYEGLTESNLPQFRDQPPVEVPVVNTIPDKHVGEVFWDRVASRDSAHTLGGFLLVTVLLLSGFLCSVDREQTSFRMLSATMYSALYALSLFLESAYVDRPPGVLAAGLCAFCFMLVTSTIALALDSIVTRAGKEYGLLLSLSIFISAAMLQWVFVRPALADHAIVEGGFQPHTAQSAHLKNTLYFLPVAILFWALPVHCVAALRRYADSGQRDIARELPSRWLITGKGIVSLNVEALACILVLLILGSIPMRSHLLDNLKPGSHTNSFTNWFYARAFLYFAFCLLCLGWYALSLGSPA